MKRMYSIHIMSPNMSEPLTDSPFTLSAIFGASTDTSRLTTAITTGRPTRSAMNAERRDHNISPSDRSRMRRTEPI